MLFWCAFTSHVLYHQRLKNIITLTTVRLCVQTAMVNGKFSTPQLSLEYMERGLRTAIAIAEPVEQPVVVTAATNEVDFPLDAFFL